MSKKIYIGVNGAAKEVDPLYVSVGGSTKKISKVYVGVDGVAKQAYPNTITYKWNRYNVINTYYWNRFNVDVEYIHRGYNYSIYGIETTMVNPFDIDSNVAGTAGTDYHFTARRERPDLHSRYDVHGWTDNVSSITITPSTTGIFYVNSFNSRNGNLRSFTARSGISSNSGVYRMTCNGDGRVTVYSISVDSPVSYSRIHKGSFVRNISLSRQELDGEIRNDGGDSLYLEYAYSSSSKGSANGSVSSTNRTQYPDNGASGSYWYEYSRLSQSQGSANGSVTSTNRSQYPDNGISGSYWYVYAGTV